MREIRRYVSKYSSVGHKRREIPTVVTNPNILRYVSKYSSVGHKRRDIARFFFILGYLSISCCHLYPFGDIPCSTRFFSFFVGYLSISRCYLHCFGGIPSVTPSTMGFSLPPNGAPRYLAIDTAKSRHHVEMYSPDKVASNQRKECLHLGG